MKESFSIEYISIPYNFQFSPQLLPERDLTNTYYLLKSPRDITIDIRKIVTIPTGVSIIHPHIVEQREGTNTINISRNFVIPLVGPYTALTEIGLVLLSPTVTYSGQPIDLVFYNAGTKNIPIKTGDILGCLSFLISPQVQLVPNIPNPIVLPKN